MHGSVRIVAVGFGMNVAPNVGSGGSVVVAFGVGVNVMVGEGNGVFVGMAACVAATTVKAAATAVL